MHYGKKKAITKTVPSVPLTSGKAPDKHMAYSILLSLRGGGGPAVTDTMRTSIYERLLVFRFYYCK